MPASDEYDYEIPRELIAQHPAGMRSDARLLVVDRAAATWRHAYIRDLPDLLAPQDAIVLNDTRVLPARLVGYRTRTGGRWSGLFSAAHEQGQWQIMSRTRGKLVAGETVTLQDREMRDRDRLELISAQGGGLWVARPESDDSFLAILERVGRVPLPPYIREGEMFDRDLADYQTVYADKPGAVAAPTAGLHFTEPLLKALAAKGITQCRVTLHVGIGTFRPLASANIEDHVMHSEWASVGADTVSQLAHVRQRNGRIVAVGTTTVRALETASQSGFLQPWSGATSLYIRPPYRFRAVDSLLTNFHLPKTTLLVLVRTFGGDELIKAAYAEAIREQYRFYSYGDAMLIL